MELKGFDQFEGVELLQRLPVFEKLSFDETNALSRILEYVDVPPGHVVIEQSSLGDALYVVLRGQLAVSIDADRDGRHGAAEEIGRLGAGDLFGEMSLVDDLLTSARVTAATSCRLARIPRRKFEELLAKDDRLAAKVYKSFCRTLSDRLRKTTARLR